LQDIEFAGISLRASKSFHNLLPTDGRRQGPIGVNRVGSATRQAGTQYLKKRTRWPAAGAFAAEPFATGRRSRRRVCFLVRRNGDGAELVESLGVSVGTASRAVRRDGK
jgi:hypothetical protein